MDKFKESLLETFEGFISFCEQHNLKYFAVAGTLLGTIRHKGFIPWDDDLDVCMPREDYERFVSLKEEAKPSWEILDVNSKGYALDFAKFCNFNTTLLQKPGEMVMGTYIDVFPLDEYNKEAYIKLKKYQKIYYYAWIVYRQSQRRYSSKYIYNELKKHKWNVILLVSIALICRLLSIPLKYLIMQIQKIIKSSKGDKYMYWSFLPDWVRVMEKGWFDETIKLPFEHLQIVCPKGYDAYLTLLYGDYMTPPPVDRQIAEQHEHFYLNIHKRMSLKEIERDLYEK